MDLEAELQRRREDARRVADERRETQAAEDAAYDAVVADLDAFGAQAAGVLSKAGIPTALQVVVGSVHRRSLLRSRNESSNYRFDVALQPPAVWRLPIGAMPDASDPNREGAHLGVTKDGSVVDVLVVPPVMFPGTSVGVSRPPIEEALERAPGSDSGHGGIRPFRLGRSSSGQTTKWNGWGTNALYFSTTKRTLRYGTSWDGMDWLMMALERVLKAKTSNLELDC